MIVQNKAKRTRIRSVVYSTRHMVGEGSIFLGFFFKWGQSQKLAWWEGGTLFTWSKRYTTYVWCPVCVCRKHFWASGCYVNIQFVLYIPDECRFIFWFCFFFVHFSCTFLNEAIFDVCVCAGKIYLSERRIFIVSLHAFHSKKQVERAPKWVWMCAAAAAADRICIQYRFRLYQFFSDIFFI